MNDGRPTRFNHALDVCIVNPRVAPLISNWEPLDEEISDHLPYLIETDFRSPARESNRRLVQHAF